MLAEVLDARLHALWDPAAADDRLAAASEIIDLARAAGDDAHERHGMFWRFVALMELGRVAEAESALAAFERAAQLAGDEAALVMVTARHAMLATLRGRFGEALRIAERVLESGRRAGLADATDLYSAVRGMVVQEQGTQQEAAFGVDLLLDAARHRPGHLFEATLAGVLATFGRLPEAGSELQRMLPQALSASGPRWLGAMAALAVAASATGDREAAGALYAALAPYRGRLVIQGGANAAAGPVSHYLGLLAAVLGRWDEAAELLSEAADLAGQIGALPSLAHARAGLADALASRAGPGDIEAAEEQRRHARSVAERLGMTVLLATLSPPADRWRLRRAGADWLLDAGDEHARLRDGRGLTTPKPANQPQAAVAATTTVPAPRARRERLSAVNGIARQFGGPSGPIGHLVTGLLARGNASFNWWLVGHARARPPGCEKSAHRQNTHARMTRGRDDVPLLPGLP